MLNAHASPTSHLKTKEDRLSAAAIHNFFGITLEWGLSDNEQTILLAPATPTLFPQMKDYFLGSCELPPTIDSNGLTRISYIMGIYKALNILLPNARRASEWLHKPNSATLFEGKSALDLMLQGNVDDLADIRRYLDAERGL